MDILKRILHATDFSQNSNQALRYACDFARTFNAELHLVHVFQDASLTYPPITGYAPPDYYQQMVDSAGSELDKLPGETCNFEGPLVRHILEGVPFVEIIRYARKNTIDMIIMGTHGRSGLSNLLIGSVAENVVRKAPCPVLTVHPDEHQFSMP